MLTELLNNSLKFHRVIVLEGPSMVLRNNSQKLTTQTCIHRIS